MVTEKCRVTDLEHAHIRILRDRLRLQGYQVSSADLMRAALVSFVAMHDEDLHRVIAHLEVIHPTAGV